MEHHRATTTLADLSLIDLAIILAVLLFAHGRNRFRFLSKFWPSAKLSRPTAVTANNSRVQAAASRSCKAALCISFRSNVTASNSISGSGGIAAGTAGMCGGFLGPGCSRPYCQALGPGVYLSSVGSVGEHLSEAGRRIRGRRRGIIVVR